jgi:hypothetical protein
MPDRRERESQKRFRTLDISVSIPDTYSWGCYFHMEAAVRRNLLANRYVFLDELMAQLGMAQTTQNLISVRSVLAHLGWDEVGLRSAWAVPHLRNRSLWMRPDFEKPAEIRDCA